MTATVMMEAPAAAAPDATAFRLRGLAMTRIETFTDAAFAFALTLLVVSLDPPTDLATMLDTLRAVPAFLLSGLMLMVFWWGHHEWSRRYGLDDGMTMILSCVLVFTVLVYVYPLRFMFGMMMLWIGRISGLPLGTRELTIASASEAGSVFVVYGTGFVAMCGSLILLNLHAWRRREQLDLNRYERHDTRSEIGAWLILMLAGALSIVLALLLPARMTGMAGWAYAPLGMIMPLYSRMRAAARRRL